MLMNWEAQKRELASAFDKYSTEHSFGKKVYELTSVLSAKCTQASTVGVYLDVP